MPTVGHIHRLNHRGSCECGFAVETMAHGSSIHERNDTSNKSGPIYINIDVGVNRLMLMQRQFNCHTIGEALSALDEAANALKEVQYRQNEDRRKRERPTEDRRKKPPVTA